MRWVIPALVALSMLAIGCQRQTTGATVNEYQERRNAALKRHHRERGVAKRAPDAELADATSGFSAAGELARRDPLCTSLSNSSSFDTHRFSKEFLRSFKVSLPFFFLFRADVLEGESFLFFSGVPLFARSASKEIRKRQKATLRYCLRACV